MPLRAFIVLTVLGVVCPLVEAQGNRKIRTVPSEATRAAGTEIHWLHDLEAALAQAKANTRPVFWYVPSLQGSPMDRKPEVDLAMMAGPFASPEVAAVLERRFIPLKLVGGDQHRERYGLERLRFIEPGFLVLAPDGTMLKSVDCITTLSNDWFLWQFRDALSRDPELGRHSDQMMSARLTPEGLATLHLEEGDGAAALAGLGNATEGESEERMLLRARAQNFRRNSKSARPLLEKLAAKPGPLRGEAAVELGRLLIREGKHQEASERLESAGRIVGAPTEVALFFRAVAERSLRNEGAAERLFQELGQRQPATRWTRKGAAEAQRLGPFMRGLERFENLPDDAFQAQPEGTRVPRPMDQLPSILARAVDLLLLLQKSDGSFDDSIYDFGGTDSLPNVYVAGTALAAMALQSWRHLDPERIDPAVERAIGWIQEDSHLAPRDEDEIVWAEAYRLMAIDAHERSGSGNSAALKAKVTAITKALITRRDRKGGHWRHEYPNPFVTATVIEALALTHPRGIPLSVEDRTLTKQTLQDCRGEDGSFTYGLSKRRGNSPPEFSAGRAPIGELALLRLGASDQARLAAAIDLSRRNHEHLERVRKYDDHADRFGNGGFFFWYALHGRRLAIDALENTTAKEAELAALRSLVVSLGEIDGGFIDSHELGRSYGTAMALLCLAGAELKKE